MGQECEDLGARGFFDDDDTWYEDHCAEYDRAIAEIDARIEARVASERVLVYRGAESDLHDDEFIWMV